MVSRRLGSESGVVAALWRHGHRLLSDRGVRGINMHAGWLSRLADEYSDLALTAMVAVPSRHPDHRGLHGRRGRRGRPFPWRAARR